VKILVTGGAGYIGSILTPMLLAEGYQVTVLDNLMFNQASLLDCCSRKNFNFVRGDILDISVVEKLVSTHDIVIPLAAIVGAPATSRNPRLSKLVNEVAPIEMLQNLSVDQMVLFPTTNSGYGVGEPGSYCDETSPLNPLSDYAIAKVRVEEAYLQRNAGVSFRLATVFGASARMRFDLLVNDFVYRSTKDRFIVLFEEHFRRNYIHVIDVARAFIFGIRNYQQMQGQPFNVGLTAANLTKRELCEKIKTHIPSLEIYTSEVGTDPDKRDYVVSNNKIESLGWKPIYSLDDGINELIKICEILKTNAYSNV